MVLLMLFAWSCKKDDLVGVSNPKDKVFAKQQSVTAVASNVDEITALNESSTLVKTVLGDEVENPYTKANIARAFKNIYGYTYKSFPTTHRYIKFSPKNMASIELLFDQPFQVKSYPLNRKVVTIGDYYLPEGKTDKDLPEIYASVPVTYNIPADIPYVVLEEMFIPRNCPSLDLEALFSVNLLESDNPYLTERASRIAATIEFPCRDYPEELGNVAPCGPQSLGKCKSITGNVTYQNVLNEVTPTNENIKRIKVHISSWFKGDDAYTDDNGNYASPECFNSEITLSLVYTAKNNVSKILRKDEISFFSAPTMERQIGVFAYSIYSKSPLNINVPAPSALGQAGTAHYCGAIAHNCILELRNYSTTNLTSQTIPKNFRIWMDLGKPAWHANTYMLNDILYGGFVASPLGSAVLAWISGYATEGKISSAAADIVLGCGGQGFPFASNILALPFLNTDRYGELVFHELCHGLHYTRVNLSNWIQFGQDEKDNGNSPLNTNGATYGPAGTPESPLIAVGEMWAYHMGHVLADQKWQNRSTAFPEQGNIDANLGTLTNFTNNLVLFSNTVKVSNTISSHINFLEDYNPNIASDPNAWLPKGLFHDMEDSIDENSPVNDKVSGFNNSDFFLTLNDKINTPQKWRDELIKRQPNNKIQITKLFTDYGF